VDCLCRISASRIDDSGDHGHLWTLWTENEGFPTRADSVERGGPDGFLSLGRLAALRLDADLVVLSACRTAGSPRRCSKRAREPRSPRAA
jgi:hypothetical protein